MKMKKFLLKACPSCGTVPDLCCIAGQNFIIPSGASPLGCFCHSFDDLTSSDSDLVKRWNDYVSTFTPHE